MANNVNNFITIEGNEAAMVEMKRIAEAINKSEHDMLELADVLWDGVFENHVSWTSEHYGAKWCMVEEACEDHLMLTSAWYQVEGVQDKLYEKLKAHDENVLVKMTYEDECPDFIGIRIRYLDEYIVYSDDDEDLIDYLQEAADEAEEEPWDMAWNERREEIYDRLEEDAMSEVKALKEELKECRNEEQKNQPPEGVISNAKSSHEQHPS
tara:strand:- start:161 stop:790 length:630 start_codon:yes stop_codon:yes gene_type:complete